GLGIPAAFVLCLAAHAGLFSVPIPLLEAPRGYFISLAPPVVAIGLQRSAILNVGVFVSRQIIFYTTSVLGAGIYLLAMAAVGFWLQSLQLVWGPLLQAIFFIAALALLVWALFSDSLRSTVKVWVSKHFYENKYDYREEWALLTQRLSRGGDEQPLGERCLHGLAQIIGAESGALWTVNPEAEVFVREYAHGKLMRSDELPFDHPLIEFLELRRWVLDLREARQQPDQYESIEHTLDTLPFERNAVLVPLQHESLLLGFVELDIRSESGRLNYEDYDLLKTAGQQVASYLAERNTSRQLAQSRQFEAFNKFTAFVMHDLNNLIGQQRLIVQNSEKFRDNPAFVDDAFMTIDNSVRRMEGLLTQLRERSASGANKRVDVLSLIHKAIDRSAQREPVPTLTAERDEYPVFADPDRLEAVLGHLIRNAQEATDATGSIDIRVADSQPEDRVVVTIVDTGIGMTSEFIRSQLFSPFISTKGSQGMGIGVYQTREYLRMLGGDVSVESEPGHGTTMKLTIPAAATE
ncbi:MAG: XrtA/PEP-CTERM system histidine kinase PrsK, partial [Pseudomonadota bacterium]